MALFWDFFHKNLCYNTNMKKYINEGGEKMSYKYDKIKKLTNENIELILKDEVKFIDFVKFCSKFYKYDFSDILCIYSQNENATAVADYNTWQRIKYQVKKGEKGIGLFDDSYYSKLRYVFDVSSTYQQKIKLWEYIEDRHKNIVDLDFSKDKFYEKYSLDSIEDEDLKSLIYYMNRLAKNTRLGIEEDSQKLENLAGKILQKIKVGNTDLFFEELCTSIKYDLLEIERNIKAYERSLQNNIKTEKEQTETVPFSVAENKPKEKLKDEEISLFNNNYYNEIKSQEKAENKNTIEKQIYKKLYEWANTVLNNETYYILMKAKGFDDLVLEYIVDGEYSLAHYSELNGDMMRSPEITFKVEDNEVVPMTYLDDYTATYIEIEDRNDKEYKPILEIFETWSKNIEQQFSKDIEKIKNNETLTEEVEQQTNYNTGDTIIFEEMVGENLPNGLKGVIKKVDDIGQIHIAWENGSSLAIDPKIDKFEVIQKEKIEEVAIENTQPTKMEETNKSSSFLISNFNIHNKKAPYPTTTNEKIQANIDAIKILIKIESEKRVARAEEKEILANYVGFGGLPQVFENAEKIESPFIREKAIELKEFLTDKEYEMARASTLKAHYTPNEVIDEIYRAISGFGYDNNIKILEPSCGTGNFIGNLPENLINSNITGVE